MKLYVARHGQTAWNAERRICGQTDLELTEEGKKQAVVLAEQVAGKGIVRILVSPLRRAQQTAGFIAEKLNLPLETEPRLIEQCYGIYEGQDVKTEGFLYSKSQFARRYPGGGESMMQLAARLYPLIDEVRAAGGPGNVLFVCHGGVCRVIHTYFEDMTNEEFVRYSAPNCQLEEYELD